MKGCRDGFGDALLALGKNKNIVALTADLGPSVRTAAFKKKYPSRHFDTGVAEQNLVTVATGLAHVGKIPFAAGFGAFMPGRCYEQIRTTISYNNNNVKLIASHTGLDVGPDGATHQILEDIAMMRALPNMTVVVPADYKQAKLATRAFARIKGPCYMRFGRSKVPDITKTFTLGKAEILQNGKDLALIGCGPVVGNCLEAARELKKENISIRVINLHTIQPLDVAALKRAAKLGIIITVEDHSVKGGMGSAVCEALSAEPVAIHQIGTSTFGESGDSKDLYEKYGLDTESIIEKIRKII